MEENSPSLRDDRVRHHSALDRVEPTNGRTSVHEKQATWDHRGEEGTIAERRHRTQMVLHRRWQAL